MSVWGFYGILTLIDVASFPTHRHRRTHRQTQLHTDIHTHPQTHPQTHTDTYTHRHTHINTHSSLQYTTLQLQTHAVQSETHTRYKDRHRHKHTEYTSVQSQTQAQRHIQEEQIEVPSFADVDALICGICSSVCNWSSARTVSSGSTGGVSSGRSLSGSIGTAMDRSPYLAEIKTKVNDGCRMSVL